MQGYFAQAVIFLTAIVIAVPLARRLGLGSVLGYLLAGIVIGPLLGLVQDSESTELLHFAEFGVVMMLFLIGLELDPRALWDMRHKLLGLGGLQILLTGALIALTAIWAGLSWQMGVALGMILSLSSTAVVLQTLAEKNLMRTSGGTSAFSVLLTQDIAVIPMLALMPLLATAPQMALNPDGSIARADAHAEDAAHHGISLVEGLPAWGVTLVTIGAVALVVLAGIFLTRPVFRYIHSANLREIYTAVALLIVIGIAVLMDMVGLSPALGTFLAGVVLANSEFRHELEASIEPFKGLLLGLFFIAVGAGINFNVLLNDPVLIISLTLALMITKGLVLFALGRLFGLKSRGQWLFALSLAQAGEFGMVLTTFALQQSVIDTFLAERLLLVIALSLLFTPLFFMLHDYMRAKLSERTEEQPDDEIDEQHSIIIAGIGRFGQMVNRLVLASGYKSTVLDNDLKTIQLMRRFGFKGFFGDPTRPELLHAAGLDTAKVLVVALDDRDASLRLVSYARRQRPDITIIARARDRVNVYELYRAGADKIVREMFDSSLRAGRYALEAIGFSDYDAAMAEQAFFQHDRAALRELAEIWDPNTPTAENAAYVARSQALEKDFETALLEQLEASRQKSA